MIYQTDTGGDNTAKSPKGGVIYQSSPASSMAISIANPIAFYGSIAVINQAGHSGDLYNYYWTSYSRGVDGAHGNTTWHNAYLDGYIPLRVKSIYDPCPYLYRLPSNGTFNQFVFNTGWTNGSYLGGASWNMTTLGESWLSGLGYRDRKATIIAHAGYYGYCQISTIVNQSCSYLFRFGVNRDINYNRTDYGRGEGQSVRCIEDTGRAAHTFCQQKVCKNCRAS